MALIYEFAQKLEELEPWPGKIRNAANDIADTWLAQKSHLDQALRDAGNHAADKTQELVDKTRPAVQDAKDMQKIEHIPEGWNEIITKLSGEIVSLFDDPDMGLRDHWEGDAAISFTAMSDQQKKAMERLLSLAKKAKETLDEVNASAEKFFTGLGCCLVGVLVAAAGALITLAGVFTGVPGAIVFGTTVAAALGTLTLLITTFNDRMAELTRSAQALNNETADASGFPGGHWPGPVTEKYGPSTNWQPK
ncbi:hypothetical protein FZI91_20050 [Mycobacterium sp. CBMA271]|uniref:hypothetical protein n=1 Tax=unclassified Mycobacteroides TaxID=2618759 RepID=UPI0012DE3EB1|nr:MULTISPECIES: hypothetical protein [unclassified Mycobacteroides]MUM17190.1 hypothetical protein [Mycobacteroides sp. CBMA 326]MUM23980.1 hypothetical protein [Mycobacteroides sp. CBMA 271]